MRTARVWLVGVCSVAVIGCGGTAVAEAQAEARLEPGVRYSTAAGQSPHVELYGLVEDGGKQWVAGRLDVECGDGLHGRAEFVGSVNSKGRAHETVFIPPTETDDPDGTFISGSAVLTSTVDSNFAQGTVDFEIEEREQGDEPHRLIKSCASRNAPWSATGTPDASLAQVASRAVPGRVIHAEPGSVAADGSALYAVVAIRGKSSLLRMNAATGHVDWSVDVPGKYFRPRLVVGADAVWVAPDLHNAPIQAFETQTGRRRVRIQDGDAMAFGTDGSAWVKSSRSSTIRRVDPRTGKTLHTIRIEGDLSSGFAVGDGAVYVTAYRDVAGRPIPRQSFIVRIDTATDAETTAVEVRRLTLDVQLASNDSSLWYRDDAGVVRLDPTTLGELGHSDGPATDDLVIAPPGLWLMRAGGLVALAATTMQPTLGLPFVDGSIAAGGHGVLLLNNTVGLLDITLE